MNENSALEYISSVAFSRQFFLFFPLHFPIAITGNQKLSNYFRKGVCFWEVKSWKESGKK